MKLFCFPHAGGFSPYYRFMRQTPCENIDQILLFDYPRRTFSGNVQFSQYILSAADFVMKNIRHGEEYILFGHSMGAFVACEAGLLLQNEYDETPSGVIASGQNPPYSEKYEKGWECPEAPYDFVRKLGGVPEFLLNNRKLFSVMMKCIEDDMKAIETYEPSEPEDDELLEYGMIIRGSDDPLIEEGYSCYWDKTFRNIYSDTVLPGDHFYFREHTSEMVRLIDEFAGAMKKERFKA